jgi:hypothetical protein
VLAGFGLVYRAGDKSSRFYPTHLLVELAAGGARGAAGVGTAGEEEAGEGDGGRYVAVPALLVLSEYRYPRAPSRVGAPCRAPCRARRRVVVEA